MLCRTPFTRPFTSRIRTRQFHLIGQASASFLETNLAGVAVSATNQLKQTDAGGKKTTHKAIKVLLHADRRPKSLPPRQSTSPIRTHFGPALIGCHDSYLEKVDTSLRGQGDLGILRAQQEQPSRVVDLPICIEQGLKLDKAFGFLLRMAPIAGMSIPEPIQWKAAEVLQQVYEVFRKYGGIWFTFELSFDGKVSINEPFLEFDDFSVGKQADLKKLFDERKRDKNTAMAEDGGLFYIKLPSEGSVGPFGYGAGNAMATMDGIALAGGKPANFLDGGGGANIANARLAIETLNRDPDVKSIFVNTFGGLTQTDLVAEGIIEAVKENDIKKPIIVRVLGTGAERARQLLEESGLDCTMEDDFKEAARMAVEQSK